MKWAIKQGHNRYEIMGAETKTIRDLRSKFNPDLTIWFQGEKYSPPVLKYLEQPGRIIFNKLRLGGLS